MDERELENHKIFAGLYWKLMERFGVQGVQFVLQIILARLLEPKHYGTLSLMLIFTALANVFIQSGFNTALIQNKSITEDDYSSVFWISLGMAGIIYTAIYAGAPFISTFYGMPELTAPLRVLAIVLFPGTLQSVQLAMISREMNFKKIFTSNLGAIVISGIIGIGLAYTGAGIWALVVQYLLNVIIASVFMLFTTGWIPKFVFCLSRIHVLLSFGWKLLVSSLLDTLYQDLSSLVIGKKYDAGVLGYYNRGKQFPQFIISSVNGAVQSVLLPAMSARQEDKSQVRQLTRSSIMLSSYIIFPIMAGLAAAARPLILLLLTEKWLPCVPFIQIFCFSFAFWPVHTSNLQAINAVGRSDIFLKLEIVKKVIGILALIIAVFVFDSPIVIAWSGCITGVISCFVNAYPNKRLIGYSYGEQMIDILPSFFNALIMFFCIFWMQKLEVPLLFILALQIFSGIGIYLITSIIFKLRPYQILAGELKRRIN